MTFFPPTVNRAGTGTNANQRANQTRAFVDGVKCDRTEKAEARNDGAGAVFNYVVHGVAS